MITLRVIRQFPPPLPLLRSAPAQGAFPRFSAAQNMKKSLFAFAVLASFAAVGLPVLRAQQPAGAAPNYAINAITPNLPKTPEIQTQGGEIKKNTPGTWAEIEVDFAASAPAAEVKIKYFVVVGGQLLVGEVTHLNVSAGRNLYSVMYVAPRTLSALLRGQPPNVNSIQNVYIQIMKPDGSGVAAEKYLKGPFPAANMKPGPGELLNKPQTPFANLWWDRYEMVKPK
jgi:hypothetical protein